MSQAVSRSTPSPGVVSFRASWPTRTLEGPDDLLQGLVVRLLDKGTQRQDRFAIADWLERRGASLSFYADGLRAGFSGRALTDDLAGVLTLAAEQLAAPAFDPAEVDKAKQWLDAAFRAAEEDSGAQADAALARALYPPDHPNYEEPFPSARERLAALTRADVVAAHGAAFARPSLTLALGGDVRALDPDALLALFATGDAPPLAETSASQRSAGVTDVPLPGKSSFDVRLGHGIALRRTDADFLPLRAALFALGGNFSSRLMQTVRDVHGLTYGIGSGLSGIDRLHDGHVGIHATLSPENLDRGVEVTRAVVAETLLEGVRAAELDDVKATLAGTHKVGLSTSGGTASALLHAVEQGLGVEYLDAFPDLVASLPLDTVNEALRRHLDPGALHLVRAGTFTAATVAAP